MIGSTLNVWLEFDIKCGMFVMNNNVLHMNNNVLHYKIGSPLNVGLKIDI
jgi:hypothetical protein